MEGRLGETVGPAAISGFTGRLPNPANLPGRRTRPVVSCSGAGPGEPDPWEPGD